MVRSLGCLLIFSTFIFTNGIATATRAAGGTGVHAPVGPDGEGIYSASTKGCFDVIDTATPLVLKELKKQFKRSNTYHIADYGTADGGTSLGLMSKMVQEVRKRDCDNEKEVVIHYEDQLM